MKKIISIIRIIFFLTLLSSCGDNKLLPTTNTGNTAPTGVTASAGDGQVIINWNAVIDATSYNIYWSTTSGVTKTTGTKITGVTSPYTHTDLTNGTTYYYVVTAINTYGESSESSQASAIPTATVTPDTTPPTNTTQANFISGGVTTTNSTSVTLSISATDSVGVTGYYASESSTTPSASATGWTAVTSLTSYSATVSFALSSGDGTKTVYVWFKDVAGNVSTSARDSITLTIGSAPSAPTGVSASAGNGQVTISWSSVSDTTSYNIYWSTTSGVTKTSGTKITGVTTPYAHTGLTNGTTYYYVVTAVNSYGESSESSQITAIPQQPISLPKTGQTTSYSTGDDGELQKGVTWPSPRFTVESGAEADCITDNLTGLMWVKSPDSIQRTWQEALDYANNLSLCGYTDWRLPNVNELESLVNVKQSNTASWLNTQGFSNVKAEYYWSSTANAYYNRDAWDITMYSGYVSYDDKINYRYVLPARAGQGEYSSIVNLPKTGQTICYDSSGNVISCTNTEQDGDIKAGITWPSPRFTVLRQEQRQIV